MPERFPEIKVISFDYENYGLNNLGQFPDVNRFYAESSLPAMNGLSIFYLNTCNRTEFLFESDSVNSEAVLSIFKKEFQLNHLENAIELQGKEALFHFFSVTSGLRSMALGETQITGQVKRAFALAQENKSISKKLSAVVSKALEVQKLVRTQTSIGENSVSLISLLECELQSRQQSYQGIQNALLGGTGDMSEKIARHLACAGLKRLTVLRADKSKPLPVYFEGLKDKIEFHQCNWSELNVLPGSGRPFDTFITSAQSKGPMLQADDIASLRKSKVLNDSATVVDLAMPANIEISAGHEEEKYYIDLSCLLKQSRVNREHRRSSLAEAQALVLKSIEGFWLDSIFKNHSEKVSSVNSLLQDERNKEWQRLINGPLNNMNAKQKRILFDYIIKHEKKSLKLQKELIVEMLASTSTQP